eukprot:COSAG04_NODE_1070_length_8477_cov_17.005729_6_plen_108_part_00
MRIACVFVKHVPTPRALRFLPLNLRGTRIYPPHLWVNAAHNRGPRCAVLQELKPLGGDTHAGRSALKRRRLQGPPATRQEELAHEPGSPARVACPSVGVELRRCYPS